MIFFFSLIFSLKKFLSPLSFQWVTISTWILLDIRQERETTETCESDCVWETDKTSLYHSYIQKSHFQSLKIFSGSGVYISTPQSYLVQTFRYFQTRNTFLFSRSLWKIKIFFLIKKVKEKKTDMKNWYNIKRTKPNKKTFLTTNGLWFKRLKQTFMDKQWILLD